MPITDITVEINNTKYPVVTGAQGEFYELEKDEYAAWYIPESALSASIGGWGGLIRCLYAERQNDELHIIQGFSDSESGVEGLLDIEHLKTIRLSE